MELTLDHVSAGYGKVPVLTDISMTVRSGQLVALVGANGAGKSTLANTIVGSIGESAGSIKFDDADVTSLSLGERVEMGVTLVPEGRHLFPGMTVSQNLMVGATPKRARAGSDERLESVLELFPRLRERPNQLAGTMSGGEQQMLAVGRGLMSAPRLLVLDEPSIGLAPNLVKSLFNALETLGGGGLTILLIEQNVRQSLRIATHAYVLDRGRVVTDGAASAMLNDSGFVDRYFGSSEKSSGGIQEASS